MLTGRPDDAAGLWARSIALGEFDTDSFMTGIKSDRSAITGYSAIDPVLIGMVADTAVRRSRALGQSV